MIQIGFSTRKWNALSAIIRWVTKCPISHCWILYHDKQFGIDMVMEESLEGLRITPFDIYKTQNDSIELYTPQYSLEVGLLKAGQDLGEKYDIDALFGTLIPMIGKWFKTKWHNPFRSPKEAFCSQKVVEIMENSDYPTIRQLASTSKDNADITPKRLRDFFIAESIK